MKILLVKDRKVTHPLYLFFSGISDVLCNKIYKKLHSYAQHGNVYRCKSLKALNSKIWKYKGTIYKLRVDNGKESARVLFCKTKEGDLMVLHAFLKSTRKTPVREAHQAIAIYQMLENVETVIWDEQLRLC